MRFSLMIKNVSSYVNFTINLYLCRYVYTYLHNIQTPKIAFEGYVIRSKEQLDITTIYRPTFSSFLSRLLLGLSPPIKIPFALTRERHASSIRIGNIEKVNRKLSYNERTPKTMSFSSFSGVPRNDIACSGDLSDMLTHCE